jgi:hypothetical protein
MTNPASTEPTTVAKPAATAPKTPRRKRNERSSRAGHGLTPAKMAALQAVAESKFLSTEQVAALRGWSGKTARLHLRDLFDLGLLDRMAVPGVLVGTRALLAPFVHYPTADGLRALETWGMLPDHALRPSAYRPALTAFLAHELAVRDGLVWMTAAARSVPGHAVEKWDCSAGLAAFGTAVDAVFVYRVRPGEQRALIAGFLEADMGTERGTSGGRYDRWAAKLRSYGELFSEQSRETIFKLTGRRSNACLAVTVTDAARAVWIRERARGTPVAERLWIAVRDDLKGAGAEAPVWLAPDGEYRPFVPPSGERG